MAFSQARSPRIASQNVLTHLPAAHPSYWGEGFAQQRKFGDIDELAAYWSNEDVTLTQLSRQPLSCEAFVWGCDTVRISFSRANCAIKAIGSKKPGFMVFVFLPQGCRHPVVSHGRSLTADYTYGFDPNRGVDMVFPGHTTHCVVYIRQDVFEACAQAMDRDDLNAKFFAPNYFYLPSALPSLHTYLNQVYTLLAQRSPLLQQPTFHRLLLQDFLPMLVAALPLQLAPSTLRAPALRRSPLVKQAEDYMVAHLDQPLTLADLCQALGTSSRALSYGFQDIFGMSPMAYLKTLRLMGVHRALKTAHPDRNTVTNIAGQFGFWSMNHFALDYKQMFGESPQETLKREGR
ncbi:helix-turn-helix domain-containing protein [Leptolyngbya sp. KIOST-1]|uniref:helix-turn-helix domain-containing protein n=1 Tax=Leptolyngbya sp. KIOST-1 TaxID=1229172 RepID=UPI00068A0596|nr:helix-turn-helix domain-containing protein [Leptolyngbya sp. KIOST-1]